MKKIHCFFVVVATMTAAVSCSSDDNSSDASSEVGKKLVGTWNTQEDLKGNSYAYLANGTAEYTNTWTNGKDIDITKYKGAWKLIEGNILIEYYPDEDEKWDKNWHKAPTMTNRIEFTNDKTMKRMDTNNNSYHDVLYKQ